MTETGNADRLTFDATVLGVKVAGKSGTQYNNGNGSLDVTFRVERPTPPHEPRWYNDGEPVAEIYDKPATFKTALKRWKEQKAAHEKELAAHEVAVAGLRPRLVAYAQIAGMAAVLDGQVVTVEIRPGEQQLLPGFGLELLAPPEGI